MSQSQSDSDSDRRKEEAAGESSSKRAKTNVGDEDSNQCPNCQNSAIESTSTPGERVCRSCRHIIASPSASSTYQHPPESWSTPKNGSSRYSGQICNYHHDKGLGSKVAKTETDGSDNILDNNQRLRARDLRKYNRQESSHRDQFDKAALAELARINAALELPDATRATGSMIYKRAAASDDITFVGRSLESLTAAALYTATRINSNARTLKEVAQVTQASKQEIARDFQDIRSDLSLKIKIQPPAAFIPRICSDLDSVSPELRKVARDIAEVVHTSGETGGRPPKAVAATAVYAASHVIDLPITQDEVGAAADLSSRTVQQDYREYLSFCAQADSCNTEIPPDIETILRHTA